VRVGHGLAALAEDAGFDGVWVFDHFKALYADPKGPCLEGWTLLAGLARETSSVRLGTLVTGMTHRIPSVLAAEVVTVDHLSGGRVECAVGAAWNEPEHRELGIPFPSVRDRMDRLEEGVQVLKLLFTQDDVSFEGRQVRLDHATYRPRPVQQPHPPIWIGGSGKPALRRVATMADGWIPQATPLDQLPADIATILRMRDEIRPGDVPEIGYHLVAHVGEPTWDLPKGVMHGSPERIADFANTRLGAIGVSHLQVRLMARDAGEHCEQIARFGAEVGPHLVRTPLV
jgi:probable F420-dependent oxidoreductase